MELKREYDHAAPPEAWTERTRECPACRGVGFVRARGATSPTAKACETCAGFGEITERIPPVAGIRILRAGPRQRFSPRLVDQGIAEGWLALERDRISIRSADGDVRYRIRRRPGAYVCCHCGAELPTAGDRVAGARTRGQLHVAEHHADTPSPDPTNPSGYERVTCYDCEREG